MVFLLGLAAVLLFWHFLASLRWGSRPTDLEHGLGYRVDLNQAERAEILQLPGIGAARAQAILNYRRSHGGFRTVDELRNIHGIGSATLERLRPWVSVATDDLDEENVRRAGVAKRPRAAIQPAVAGPQKAKGHKKGKKPKTKIDVNRASVEELQEIPRIGEVRARNIVEERRKGLFRSVDDLKRVPGIKDRMVEYLRPYVTCGKGRVGAKSD
jgi:competence protein ComEA